MEGLGKGIRGDLLARSALYLYHTVCTTVDSTMTEDVSVGDVVENTDNDDDSAVDEELRTVQFMIDDDELESTWSQADEQVTNGDQQDDDDSDGEGEEVDEVPWHHMQLYHLYGDAADYFLHPTFTGVIHKRLSAKPKIFKGRCNVGSAMTAGRLYRRLHFN